VPSPRPDEPSASSAEPHRIEALIGLRKWDEAIRLSSERVAQHPGDANALVLLARSFHGADRNDEAITTARAARAAAPGWDEPFRIEAWAMAPKDPLGAVIAARGARERNPGRVANWTALSYLAAQAGQLDEADEAAAGARHLGPGSAEAMNVSGVVALKRKQNAEAEQWFRRGLAVDPLEPNLMNNLALALRNQGRGDEAMALFERSLAADPRGKHARKNLGATVRQEMWKGGARFAFLGSVLLLWLGLTSGSNVMLATGAATAVLTIVWLFVRRARFTEARRSALREYEKDLGRRSGSSAFRDPARRRRVIVLVALILVCVGIFAIGTMNQSAPSSVYSRTGP